MTPDRKVLRLSVNAMSVAELVALVFWIVNSSETVLPPAVGLVRKVLVRLGASVTKSVSEAAFATIGTSRSAVTALVTFG